MAAIFLHLIGATVSRLLLLGLMLSTCQQWSRHLSAHIEDQNSDSYSHVMWLRLGAQTTDPVHSIVVGLNNLPPTNSHIVYAGICRRAIPSLSTDHHVTTWIMMMCGDVEMNPGPARPADIFPCGFCDLAVSWSEHGVQCDGCSVWFHPTCHSMSETLYDQIGTTDRTWKCFRCCTQVSDTFHSYELDPDHQHHTLNQSDSSRSASVSSAPSPGSFQPQRHSSSTDASWCPPGADTTQHTVFVLKHGQHHRHWRPHPEQSQELEIHGGKREQHSEQEGWIRDGSKLLQAWRHLYVRDETQSRHSQRRVHAYRLPRPAKEGQKQTWRRSSASDPGLLLSNRSGHAQQYSRDSLGSSIPQTPNKAVPRSILPFTKWGCCQTDGRTGNVTQES